MPSIEDLETKVAELRSQNNAWLIDNPTQCRVLDHMDLELQEAEEALGAARKDLDLKDQEVLAP
ncbi:hypothetical protein [Sulfitobacter sp. R18_1]|uniref:hypothetical protein n=1 Tax=Sulfitobacter sp. R18_1 TaxID=2821104 RepID=UPI001ADBEB13|nr:hypothetical protein [Sulfitobacter sp. R18_1]MBO9428083.1 hypothetical protein [Sulfitobacter sp. R18_1]